MAQTIRLHEHQAELREHKFEMAQQQLQSREREHALELGLAAAKHAAERAMEKALVKIEASSSLQQCSTARCLSSASQHPAQAVVHSVHKPA